MQRNGSFNAASFTFHRAITIDHTKVPNTDQNNFPVLISGTYPFLATVANGGKVQSPSGYDIVFSIDCVGDTSWTTRLKAMTP
jgi:hypothetical protein